MAGEGKAKRKIAILGTAPTWKDAPFGKSDWEIWVCNRAGLSMKPWHRLFEIHTNWDYESPDARDKFLADLRAVKPPQEVLSIVPIGGKANTVLDRKALFEKYGAVWFSSSFGYMAAHALEQKPTDIGFFGVDLESTEEVVVQFAGVRHFIAIAKERGVKVHIPDRSALARDPSPYPDRFEKAFAYAMEAKVERLQKMIDRTAHRLEKAKRDMWLNAGRGSKARSQDETLDETKERWKNEADIRDAYERNVVDLQSALDNLKGQLMATRYYQRTFVYNAVAPSDIGDTRDEV